MPGTDADTYGRGFTVEAFFHSEPTPEDVGGWLIRGYNSADVYEEVIVRGEWKQPECFEHVQGWIEWFRTPIPRGSPLLA